MQYIVTRYNCKGVIRRYIADLVNVSDSKKIKIVIDKVLLFKYNKY